MKQTDPFIAYLDQRREIHRKGLSELDTAERLYRESGIKPHFPLASVEEGPAKPKNSGEKPTSIKLMILGLINEEMPHGLTSPQLLERIHRHFMHDYPRKNLAPKLTGYKRDGLISPGHGVWKITEEGKAFLAKS